MTKKRMVIALGGNAILSEDASAKAQQIALDQTAKQLVELIKQGYQLVISHGNGPQVGNLLLQQQAVDSEKNPAMPLDTCVAMTQGSIGYWLQNSLDKELFIAGIKKEVATIVTQVSVDKEDPAFSQPTKPIGPFLSQEQAEIEMKKNGTVFKEDAGRGWRKVVASPKPLDIKEHRIIKTMIENDIITISAGGGGIPIIGDELLGVEAVIDKDFASELLAELVEADVFVILTGVDNVAINYGKVDEKQLHEVTIAELEKYKAEGHFAPGSMLPKIEAAISYVKAKPNSRAVITSLEKLGQFGTGNIGTIIKSR